MKRTPSFAAILVAGVAPAIVAQVPPSAVALPVDEAPAVDGRLDEAAWSEAPAIADFVQREPVEGSSVSQPTEVRILTDGEALYVGAWLYDDDPSSIVFGETLRDASLGDADAFSLILDCLYSFWWERVRRGSPSPNTIQQPIARPPRPSGRPSVRRPRPAT